MTIQANETASCFGCMNLECKGSGRSFTAVNRRGLGLSAGQLVEVGVPSSAVWANAAAVFLPPLLCFAAAWGLTASLAPASTEAARAGAGAAGLIAGFFGVYGWRRLRPSDSAPEVVRIIPE